MAILQLENVTIRFGGLTAVDGVNLAIDEGRIQALIGPNGAGKSTILLHLNGLLPETFDGEPSVVVMDKPVTSDNLPEIRRNVGLLFQDANDQLFCPTVFEDVAFGPQQYGLCDPEIRERVARALAKVGLPGFEKRAPHHLSVGEKRRVCLAGVLACDPSILALDEPTTSLDPRGRRELKELLRTIPITKLIATHDLEMVVELCSRVIVLDRGMVAAEGPTVDLLSNEDLMQRHSLERPHILRHLHPH